MIRFRYERCFRIFGNFSLSNSANQSSDLPLIISTNQFVLNNRITIHKYHYTSLVTTSKFPDSAASCKELRLCLLSALIGLRYFSMEEGDLVCNSPGTVTVSKKSFAGNPLSIGEEQHRR